MGVPHLLQDLNLAVDPFQVGRALDLGLIQHLDRCL